MAIGVTVRPYGAAAFEALTRTVRAAKDGDPLAPVTVVVERGSLGLTLRRRLAGAPPGVANVRFATWDRLAADLAAGWLGRGRRPAGSALVHEAVRAALAASSDGTLAATGDQPATVRAVARTYRELAGVDSSALSALGRQSDRTREIVALVLAVRARLDGYYERDDLLRAAVSEIAADGRRAVGLGRVVVYLPGGLAPCEQALLGALAVDGTVDVIVGATGDEAADAPTRTLVDRLCGQGKPNPAAWAAAPPWADSVRLAPSADAEALMAMRHLMRRHRQGVPLERMAVLHAGVPPYPQLLSDLAALADVPVHGAVTRTLAATLPGRVLLGALSLPERDWRRDDVISWCSTGPMFAAGRPVPAATWDVVSCEAGVVGGLDQWRDRLAAHGRRLRARAALAGARPGRGLAGGGTDGSEPALDAARCDELTQFVEWAAVTVADRPRTWEGWARWATGLLAEVLGGPSRRAQWPAAEVLAHDAVVDVLGGLAELDTLGGSRPTLTRFGAALSAALDAPAPDTARFGRGLLVGRVETAVGLDLDVVWCVGAVDGAFPAAGADDLLVPDRQREAADRAIPRRARGTAEALRDYLAVVAGAAESVVSCPVGDHRARRHLRPARVLLHTVSRRSGAGRRILARDLAAGGAPGCDADRHLVAGSYALVVAGDGEPVSPADWTLRSLVRWAETHRGIGGHFLAATDPALAGALAARRARRSAAFTRFDGLVAGVAVPSPAGGALGSPTGLETFARCPRRYLLSTVLGVRVRERPEAVLRLSALDRGELVHRILERLIAGELEAGVAGDEARLAAIADDELADAERRGITGHRVFWEVDRGALLADLRQFLRDDAEYRSATGATPVAVEDRFGSDGRPGLGVALGPGISIRFSGRIDRVDALPGGGVAVIDYKAGKVVDDGLAVDPVARGTRLQLAVYGLDARQRHGADGPVTAGYWFVGKTPVPVGIAVDSSVEERLAAVLKVIAGSITDGRFPANPGPIDEEGSRGSNCAGCPYDTTCAPDRLAVWRRKRDDPSLAAYVAMAEPA